ncbi:MAG: hypothetical protein ACOC1U_03890 [Spirochaetota bacterium]
MTKLRAPLTILLVILAATTAWSQSTASSGPASPEETDIIVPELVLEVEELEVQEVTAVLPEEGELAMGQVSIPLPGADELGVDEGAFIVSAPGMGPAPQDASVFTSGRLGAGSVNYVAGELSIYKLGTDPRYRLGFSHEGLDGYQFNDPGTGFFSQSNRIDGWLGADAEPLSTELEASFTEEVDGLQDQSDYFSAGLRRTAATANLTFTPDPLVELTATLDASIANRIQSASGGAAIPREQEFVLAPFAQGSVAVGVVDIVLSTSYFLRFLAEGEIPIQQDVEALAGLDVALPASWSASGRAGISWDPGNPLAYPWSLSLQGVLGEALETTLSGGYRVERLTLSDIWTEVPIAAVGDADGDAELTNDGQWYGSLAARWSGPSGFTVTGSAEFVAHDAVVDLLAYDAVEDEFPFEQRSMRSVAASARASWRPNPGTQVQVGWTGTFLDQVTGAPTSAVDGSVRVSDPSERLSATAEARQEFYPDAALPWLSVSGSFAPSDEIAFILEFSDVIALLAEDGRPAIGAQVSPEFQFIEPGFRASFLTRLSL